MLDGLKELTDLDGDLPDKIRPIIEHVVKTIMNFVQSDGNFDDVLANMNFEKIIGDFMAVLSPLWDMDAKEMGSGDYAQDSLEEILAFIENMVEMLQSAVPELMKPDANIEEILMNVIFNALISKSQQSKFLARPRRNFWTCFRRS